MFGSKRKHTGIAALAALSLLLSVAVTPAAALTLEPGQGCDFGLSVDTGNGGPQHYREATDKDGNVLWWLSAGRGNDLVFTNLDSGATFSTNATGAAWKGVPHPDGSLTVTMTGQNVLIMFPTDVPAGPSTTIYSGRVVFDIGADGVYTIRSIQAAALDVCAMLS